MSKSLTQFIVEEQKRVPSAGATSLGYSTILWLPVSKLPAALTGVA